VNVVTENLISEIQVRMHTTKHCCSGDNTPPKSGGTRLKSGTEDHQSQLTFSLCPSNQIQGQYLKLCDAHIFSLLSTASFTNNPQVGAIVSKILTMSVHKSEREREIRGVPALNSAKPPINICSMEVYIHTFT
jgi:hypothetical protein